MLILRVESFYVILFAKLSNDFPEQVGMQCKWGFSNFCNSRCHTSTIQTTFALYIYNSDNICPIHLQFRRHLPNTSTIQTTFALYIYNSDDICQKHLQFRRHLPYTSTIQTTFALYIYNSDNICPIHLWGYSLYEIDMTTLYYQNVQLIPKTVEERAQFSRPNIFCFSKLKCCCFFSPSYGGIKWVSVKEL